jgi:hypothetical protein
MSSLKRKILINRLVSNLSIDIKEASTEKTTRHNVDYWHYITDIP